MPSLVFPRVQGGLRSHRWQARNRFPHHSARPVHLRLAPNQAQSARRFQINPAPPGFQAGREATPPWAALRESDMRLISLSQLRDDELRFWQSEFRLHVGERCQELFSISRECGLSAKRISDASISSCLFLACRANRL